MDRSDDGGDGGDAHASANAQKRRAALPLERTSDIPHWCDESSFKIAGRVLNKEKVFKEDGVPKILV